MLHSADLLEGRGRRKIFCRPAVLGRAEQGGGNETPRLSRLSELHTRAGEHTKETLKKGGGGG